MFPLEQFELDGGKTLLLNPADRANLLKQKIKPKEIIPILYSARAFLEPEDAFDFVMSMGSNEDSELFKNASFILKSLVHSVNLSSKIENFSPTDESMKRALLVNVIPIPFNEQASNFILRAATSPLPLNRVTFLRVMKRLSKYPNLQLEQSLFELYGKVIDRLFTDPSPCVLSHIIEPALFFLKNSSTIQNKLSNLLLFKNLDVTMSLASHFDKIFPFYPDFFNFFKREKDLRILSVLIPHLAKFVSPSKQASNDPQCIDEVQLSPIFSNSSHIIRVLVLRYFPSLPENFLKEYINDTSDEIMPDVITFINKMKEDPIPYAKIMYEIRRPGSWRADYELLSFRPEIMIQIGDPALKLACESVTCHPLLLAQQASRVLLYMGNSKKEWSSIVNSVIKKLSTSTKHFDSIIYQYIQKNSTQSQDQS